MSEINPSQIYGIIGYPVKHSFSPAMHNAAFRALKIDAEYRMFEVKPEELEDFLLKNITVKDTEGKEIFVENIFGFNVTVPHKEKILDFVTLDSEYFFLKQIRAVNTIVRKDGKWIGCNTDIPGFSRDLKEKNIDPTNKKVAILGAGGAAKAVAYIIAKSKARNISVYDIDKVKSKKFVELIKGLFSDFDIQSVENISELNIKNKNMLINATPVGLSKEDPCLISEDELRKDLFIYDLIYNPPETKLLKLAKQKGAKVSNGLGMLLYQGVLSFGHFTGRDAPIDIMRHALQEELKKCQKQ